MMDDHSLTKALRQATNAATGGDATVHFGVAVSGGPDSMALLDIASTIFPGRIWAATVDHGLRAASASEAAMVAQYCATWGIPHAILRPDEPAQGNVQAWARRVRYALLDRWRITNGIGWIMTAHHADDQLETMLMRLNRGAGVGGLAGIRGRSGAVLRPFLSMRRADLLAFAQARGLPYVDDPSNTDPRFDRAALRARLAEVDWINRQAAARSAVALGEAEEALDWAVETVAAAHLKLEDGIVRLTRTDVPAEIQRRLLQRMLLLADPGASPPRGDVMDRALVAARGGGKVSIGHWLLQGGPCWSLSHAPPRTG